MKALIAAAGLVLIGTTAASADPPRWRRDAYPYAERQHAMCQDKAFRLWNYERRATRDYVLTRRERETIRALQYDLDRTCGRYRWRG
jgi:hypothetical protein